MIESNDWRLEAGPIGPHKERFMNIPIYQIDFVPLSEEQDHVHCACCIYLTWISVKPKVLKVISLLLVALLILPIGFLGFIALVFGGIGKDTVIQSVPSPSGKYYAELIDSDQGALGGDTLVDVHHSKQINALLFQIEKEPQRVYRGEWGGFEDMEIYWKDDHCLVINSVEYIVD